MKKWLIIFLWIATPVVAQDAPHSPNDDSSSLYADSHLERRLDLLEQHVNNQELLSLRRVEGVEGLITSLDHNINRILLIFGLAMFLALALMVNYHRAQTRLSSERVNRAVREAESLMRDIHGDLLRPEMEFLRIGHFLRQIMRNFFEQTPDSAAIAQMRVYARDPNLPMSLHCISQALLAEYEKRWSDAAKILEQLRQLEPKEPFVLLHLSGVHRQISERFVDIPEKQKHTKLANQYYAQYAMVVRLEDAHLPTTPAPPPYKPSTRATAATPPPVSEHAPTPPPADAPVITPPPTTTAPITAPAHQQTAKPRATSDPGANPDLLIQVKNRKVAPPAKPATANAPSAVASNATQNGSTPSQTSTIVPPAKPTPANAPSAVASNATQNGSASSQTSVIVPPAQQTAQVSTPPTNGVKKPNGKTFLPSSKFVSSAQAKQMADKAGTVFKSSYANLVKNLNGATNILNPSPDKMPFLPVPGLSVVPKTAETPAELSMWEQIRKGDLCMAQAESIMSIRRRNNIIDKALTYYAKAQVHKTNETLYLNWGLAFLGKALHLPEKKRDPFFNAAIDKFMAGNVISPHQFDFVLASLYGIIGHANDCRKWLAKSQESGKINQESLRSAPDFDNVRNLPWFTEFMQD
ncbi:MAG: hypothetical protein ACNYPH_03865 [Gammaproteobacteria bacterium WSBS_2016_MAG_OTU1]